MLPNLSALDIGVSKAKLVLSKSSKLFLLRLEKRKKRELQLERYAKWVESEASREQRVGYRLRYEIRGPVRIEDADPDLVENVLNGSGSLCKGVIDEEYLAETLDGQSQFLWTIHPAGSSLYARALGFAVVEISNLVADLHIICAARGGMALFVELLKWLKTTGVAVRFRLQPVSLDVLSSYDAAVRATFTNKKLVREKWVASPIEFGSDYFDFILYDAELRPRKTQEEMFETLVEKNAKTRSWTPSERLEELLKFRNAV